MFEMDYDKAASVWAEKDKAAVKMGETALKERIEGFIQSHSTCALAVGSGDFVRCTPIEYNYVDERFYLFSEGGLKFKGLKNNENVALAIYEPFDGFQNLKGLQIMGRACIVEPFNDEYLKIMEYKKIPVEAMKKLPQPMHLIRIIPDSYDLLDSDLKKEGFGTRQHLDILQRKKSVEYRVRLEQIKLVDLMHPNNGMLETASELFGLAVKQLSRARFIREGELAKAQILYKEEIITVVVSDDISTTELKERSYLIKNPEPSLSLFQDELSKAWNEKSLMSFLDRYKKTFQKGGASLSGQLVFKMYSTVELVDPYRDLYYAKWIDYEKQLQDGDIIYDENKMNGIWAFPVDMLGEVLNNECKNRYGSCMFILGVLPDEKYFLDKKEIIGDRFRVLDKIDFSDRDDVGRLYKRLYEYYKNEHLEEMEKIKQELRTEHNTVIDLIDANSSLAGALSETKRKMLITGFAGVVIGIAISFLISGLF